VTDAEQDFVPVEPTPVVAQPAVAPAVPPEGAVPPPPPGYYNPTAPQYAGQVYPGQAAPGAYPPNYAYTPAPPRGLSIASMVLGIASIVFSIYGFGLFPGIAAVITGHLGRKRQPAARGFSLAGLITGYVGIGIALLWIAGIIVVVVIGVNGGFDDGSSTFGTS
jgi:hypothetical protein